MTQNPHLLVMLCVLAIAAGQIIFKVVSGKITDLSALLGSPAMLFLLATAVALYALSTLAWIVALRQLPLSQAYVMMSLGFILVPVAAHLLLGEEFTIAQVIGAVLIIAGIYVSYR